MSRLVVVSNRVPLPGTAQAVPLLLDRPLVDGSATAYVCRGFVCERPTTDPATLTAQLTPERDG